MQYLLLICEDPTRAEAMSAAEREGLVAAYRTFTDRIVQSGNFRAGDALEPVATATTIRLRAGKRLVVDGPFAETKEHLVGYYLVDAKDLDEALALAEGIPSTPLGAVEVRPIRRFTR
jgi:hypothetical protein